MIAWLVSLYYRWRISRAASVLDSLDDWMTAAGYKRHERRQFWREYTRKASARKDVIERLASQ